MPEPLPGRSGGCAERGADGLPGVSVGAGRPDGRLQLGLRVLGNRPGSGDPAEACGAFVNTWRRAQAKESTVNP